MCTLNKALNNCDFSIHKSTSDSTPELSSLKSFDSDKIIYSLENLLRGSHEDLLSSQTNSTQLSSNNIIYYGKNPIIISGSINSLTKLKHSLEYYCPVAMVFDSAQLIEDGYITAVYPFDPINSTIPDAETPLESFKIEVNKSSISKYIIYFFGSIENYLNGEPQTTSFDHSSITNTLHTAHIQNPISEADLTISLILKNSFDFFKYAKCIVLPYKLAGHPSVKELLKTRGICFKFYNIRRGRIPSAYNQTVEELCNEFIHGEGYCSLAEYTNKKKKSAPICCTKNKRKGCPYHA